MDVLFVACSCANPEPDMQCPECGGTGRCEPKEPELPPWLMAVLRFRAVKRLAGVREAIADLAGVGGPDAHRVRLAAWFVPALLILEGETERMRHEDEARNASKWARG